MKAKTFLSVSFYLVVFCLLAFAVSLIVIYANAGQQDFYVQHGSLELSGKESLALPAGGYSVFYCKYVLADDNKGYDVEVIPAGSAPDFTYTVDGDSYSFAATSGLAQAFNLSAHEGYFVIYIESGLTMRGVLEKVYPGKAIADVPDIDLTARDYFTLAVSSKVNTSVNISFRLQAVES